MLHQQSILRMTWCAIASLALVGCQDSECPWGAVSGVVRQNGKPAEPAIVLFSNREIGVEITAETDAEGRFMMRTDRIAGLPVADYRVAVLPNPTNLPAPEQGMMFNGPAPVTTPSAIPADFREIATSPLQAKVVEGSNVFDFELSSSQR